MLVSNASLLKAVGEETWSQRRTSRPQREEKKPREQKRIPHGAGGETSCEGKRPRTGSPISSISNALKKKPQRKHDEAGRRGSLRNDKFGRGESSFEARSSSAGYRVKKERKGLGDLKVRGGIRSKTRKGAVFHKARLLSRRGGTNPLERGKKFISPYRKIRGNA